MAAPELSSEDLADLSLLLKVNREQWI